MTYWPRTYQGAISLTFDDGLPSHLDIVAPQLNSRNLSATFYLNPKTESPEADTPANWQKTLEKWRPIQAGGHEIGNHTLTHPCSLNVNMPWQMGKNLISWTLDQIETDILEAQRRISLMFPEQKTNSFAYPCYESTLGCGPERKSYTPVVAKYFVAARARGELRGDLANHPLYCDLHHLSSWNVERQAGAFMIGLVEQAISHHLWGIFTFHGVNEGRLSVGEYDFLELVDHLVRRSDVVWVAPVATIATHIHNLRKTNDGLCS